MAILHLLKVNQRIEIELNQNKNTAIFPSRIEEIGEDVLIIAAPLHKGVPLMVEEGRHLAVRVVIDRVPYRFISRLLRRRSGVVPLWEITLPRSVKKIQQRNYVRLDVMIPVIMVVDDGQGQKKTFRAVTKDLSGGGALVVLREELNVGTKCFLVLTVPDSKEVKTAGEIVRIDRPQPDGDIYWTAVKFLSLRETERDLIIRFIFKKQLELKRKGLLK